MTRTLIVEENAQTLERYQIQAGLITPRPLNCSAQPVHLNNAVAQC
jgi:hypothetical protein